jgi:LysM repeat protein
VNGCGFKMKKKISDRRKRVTRNRTIATIFSLVILSLLIISTVTANGETKKELKSITIRSGETLWSIASDYRKPGQDVRKLIEEIKKANNMNTSIIIAGETILVPIN